MADSDAPGAPAAPTPAAPPAPKTLGEMLRSARLAHDLTLEQLATELRIEARQLAALEENRFEQIGVPVFVKGYLKQYGQRLGIDVSDLLALYYKQTTLADVLVQPSRSIKLRDDRQITSWVLAGLVLLLVIVGLAVWWWNGGNFAGLPLTRGATTSATSAPLAASEPAVQTPSPLVEQSPAPAPSADLPPAAAAPIDSAPAASSSTSPESPAAPPASVVESSAAAAPAPADNEAAAPVVAIPLAFTFAEESWAEVTDARGERLLFGLTAAGREVTVRGVPPFAVVLGNSNAVQLTVDGEPYAIPASRQGDLARFSVDVAEE